MKKTGYGSTDLLNGEEARVRIRTCPFEYDKDNENECLVPGGYCGQPHEIPFGWFYLPHSCGEWVIGDREQARAMANDLLAGLGREGK